MVFLRNTAYHIWISDINKGKIERDENSSFIRINDNKVSRVNLIGVVVSKQDKTIVLDDSSSAVKVFEFDTNYNDKLKIGDFVNAIGIIREANAERYIAAEIIKKINKKWMFVRKKELGSSQEGISESNITNKEINVKQKEEKPKEIDEPEIEEVKEEEIESSDNSILDYIRKNDKGNGVDIDLVIENLKISEEDVQDLLKQGEIFLIKPGIVKVLE